MGFHQRRCFLNSITRRKAILATAIGLTALLPIVDAHASGLAPGSSAGLKFQMYRDSKGGYRWKLKAANGKVIATGGEAYTTKAACQSGIDLVMKGAATATIEDDS